MTAQSGRFSGSCSWLTVMAAPMPFVPAAASGRGGPELELGRRTNESRSRGALSGPVRLRVTSHWQALGRQYESGEPVRVAGRVNQFLNRRCPRPPAVTVFKSCGSSSGSQPSSGSPAEAPAWRPAQAWALPGQVSSLLRPVCRAGGPPRPAGRRLVTISLSYEPESQPSG